MPLLGSADGVYHNGVMADSVYAGDTLVWSAGMRFRQTSPTQLTLTGAEPGKTYAIFHSNPVLVVPDAPYSPSGFQGTVTTDGSGRATVTLADFSVYHPAFQPLDGVTLPGGKYSVHEVPPPALRLIETHNRLQRENPIPIGITDFFGKVVNGEDTSDFQPEHFAADLKVMLANRQASGETGVFSEILRRDPDDASPEFAGFLRKYQQAKGDENSSSESISDVFREFFQDLTPENLPPEFTEVIQTLTERSGLSYLVDEEMPPDFVRAILENLDVSQFGIITDIISAIIYIYAAIIAYIIVWIYYVIFVAIAEIIAAIIAWMDGIELPEFPDIPPGTIDSIADILTAIVLVLILSLIILSIGRVSDGIATCMVGGEMIPYLRGRLNYKQYKLDISTNLVTYTSSINPIGCFYTNTYDYHYSTAPGIYVYRGSLPGNPPLAPGWSFEGSPGLRLLPGSAATNGVRIKCFTSPMSSDPVIGQPWSIETEFYDSDTDKTNWDTKLIADVDAAPAGLFDGTLGLTTGPREANPTADVAWTAFDPSVTHAAETAASRYVYAMPRYRIVYTGP